jgi:hypothetical protein
MAARRPVTLNMRIARVRTAQVLARRYGRAWKRVQRRELRCELRPRPERPVRDHDYRVYDCHVSWHYRRTPYRGHVTVMRANRRITARLHMRTIRSQHRPATHAQRH